MKKILLISVIAIIISALGLYYYGKSQLYKEIPIQNDIQFQIERGSSYNSVLDRLNQEDIMEPAWLFKLAAKYADSKGKKMIAGYYRFKPGMSNYDVFTSIFSGKNLDIVRVTFPEGISYQKIARILAEKAEMNENEILSIFSSKSKLKKYGIDAKNAEGYILPSTYEFYRQQNIDEVMKKLFDHSEKIWKKYETKAKSMNLSRHELLTLASIVEAESPVSEERPRVAGVYLNRLKINMLLQADPTVQYAIGKKKRLLYKDLEYNSPYNTYKYAGLPPGPINCPSENAIKACVNFEKHKYYYFVAKGDGSGEHNFSPDLAGHNRNKVIFKRNVRKWRRG